MVVLALLVLAGAWEWSAFPGFTQHSATAGLCSPDSLCADRVRLVVRACSRGERGSAAVCGALIWWLVAFAVDRDDPGQRESLQRSARGLLVLVPAWLALVRLHARRSAAAAVPAVARRRGGRRRLLRRPAFRSQQTRAEGQSRQDLGRRGRRSGGRRVDGGDRTCGGSR